jgi:hypothetical protein
VSLVRAVDLTREGVPAEARPGRAHHPPASGRVVLPGVSQVRGRARPRGRGVGPGLPRREIHGYRISQLFSSKVDPGEILREYRTTRYPDRFYNLKIGIPWADLERRLDVMSVLALCTDTPMLDASEEHCTMGVDTGRSCTS